MQLQVKRCRPKSRSGLLSPDRTNHHKAVATRLSSKSSVQKSRRLLTSVIPLIGETRRVESIISRNNGYVVLAS